MLSKDRNETGTGPDCFAELAGSFLKLSGSKWTFAHPTISDALTEILRQKPHMMAALVRGATIDTILSSFICEGMPQVLDALVIPNALDDALVSRLGRTPDEVHRNWFLFHFLANRASEAVFIKAILQFPDLLWRLCWQTDIVGNDPKIAAHARAHRLGHLQDELRLKSVDRLEAAVLKDLDINFFDDEDILALIPPMRLLGLGLALRTTVLPSLENRIDDISVNADLDEESASHFDKLLGMLDRVEVIGVDIDAACLIENAREKVSRSIADLDERKRERDEESEDETDWTHIVTQKKDEALPTAATAIRSVFDDVDA